MRANVLIRITSELMEESPDKIADMFAECKIIVMGVKEGWAKNDIEFKCYTRRLKPLMEGYTMPTQTLVDVIERCNRLYNCQTCTQLIREEDEINYTMCVHCRSNSEEDFGKAMKMVIPECPTCNSKDMVVYNGPIVNQLYLWECTLCQKGFSVEDQSRSMIGINEVCPHKYAMDGAISRCYFCGVEE